jgi:tetratricopeptide (TPR) repeat protein
MLGAHKYMPSIDEIANQAISLHQNGQLEEACILYDQILSDSPDLAEILFYRGALAAQIGEFETAITYLKKAAAGAPHVADIPFNLGVVYKELGRYEDAVAAYQKAIELNADFTDAHNNLGYVLQSLNRLEEAAESYRHALEIDPNHVAVRTNLAILLKQCGDFLGAAQEFETALKFDQGNVNLQSDLQDTYQQMVPSWHFPMLNDTVRNDVYAKAIAKAVTPNDIVLDIGTGSGLLAMMAAKAGAKHVYACEIIKPIADMAKKIIAENGFGEKITIIDKNSTELQIGRDLPNRATLLVSEILDIGLIGEGVLPSLKHAKSSLITENAAMIPTSGTVWGMLINCDDFKKLNTADTVHGFDLRSFNYFRPTSYGFDLEKNEYTVLSEPFEIFSIDFDNIPDGNQNFELNIPVITDGNAQAIVTWFDLNLFEGIEFSTRKGEHHNHWRQIVYFLDREADVRQNDELTILAGHSDKKIFFKFPT